jgi:hypothetical protein
MLAHGIQSNNDELPPASAGSIGVVLPYLGFRATALHPRLYSAARIRGLKSAPHVSRKLWVMTRNSTALQDKEDRSSGSKYA